LEVDDSLVISGRDHREASASSDDDRKNTDDAWDNGGGILNDGQGSLQRGLSVFRFLLFGIRGQILEELSSQRIMDRPLW